MDGSRFDSLVSHLAEPGSRRRALGVLGLSALLAGGLHAGPDALAGRHGKHKQRKGKKGKKGGGGTTLNLRDLCTPGQSTCVQGLKCDSPTTRHTCDSTVDDIAAWCCVPPGGRCTECDCCGDNYCGGEGTCIPNPEG
jgi:hypothetical protein